MGSGESGVTPNIAMSCLNGVNEMGLAGGALYFKGYADFPQPSKHSGQVQLSALDFLHYALGSCASLGRHPGTPGRPHLGGNPGWPDRTVAPMHWMFTDLSGRGLVVEQTALGLHIYENPVGVLTNSPDFPWQMTNLRNYLGAAPEQTEQVDWNGLQMEPIWTGWRNKRLARRVYTSRPICADCFSEAAHGYRQRG